MVVLMVELKAARMVVLMVVPKAARMVVLWVVSTVETLEMTMADDLVGH